VERGAFDILKNAWQFLDRPIFLNDLKDINRFFSCLLLHKILVTERVMQEGSASYNYRERYNPSKGALAVLNEVEQPANIQVIQAAPARETRTTVVGINNAPPPLQAAMTRCERFAELKDLLAENRRLHKVLMDKFNVERMRSIFFSFQLSSF
jgi:hypothetical protein